MKHTLFVNQTSIIKERSQFICPDDLFNNKHLLHILLQCKVSANAAKLPSSPLKINHE